MFDSFRDCVFTTIKLLIIPHFFYLLKDCSIYTSKLHLFLVHLYHLHALSCQVGVYQFCPSFQGWPYEFIFIITSLLCGFPLSSLCFYTQSRCALLFLFVLFLDFKGDFELLSFLVDTFKVSVSKHRFSQISHIRCSPSLHAQIVS